MIIQESIGEDLLKVRIEIDVKTKTIVYAISGFVYHQILFETTEFSTDYTTIKQSFKLVTLNLN